MTKRSVNNGFVGWMFVLQALFQLLVYLSLGPTGSIRPTSFPNLAVFCMLGAKSSWSGIERFIIWQRKDKIALLNRWQTKDGKE